MSRVFCPKSGKIEWANERGGKNKGKDPTCIRCGEPHPEVKK